MDPGRGAGAATGVLPTLRWGTGQPVVLLPGLSLAPPPPRGMARALESALALPLARHHQVHWVSRRPGLPRRVTIADLAADVAGHLEHHFDHPVPVVGFSTGGFVALQLALDHPDLVESLVVVGAGARLSDGARAQEQRLGDLLEQGRIHAAWRELAAEVIGARAAHLLGPSLAHLAPGVTVEDARDAAATCRADLAFDATGRLGSLSVPTLLVVGMNDSACDPAMALRTRAAIPGAELVLLPRTGHLASMVHPSSVHRMQDFIARHSRAQSEL